MNCELLSFQDADTSIMHFAILQPKSYDVPVNPVDPDSFFSRPGGGVQGADRTKNFNQFATAPGVDWDINCLGINRNKWNIVTHAKRVLTCKGTAYPKGSPFWKYEKYFSMKGKRMMFDSTSADYTSRPLVAVMWYERMTNDSNLSTTLNFNLNTVAYFSNAV